VVNVDELLMLSILYISILVAEPSIPEGAFVRATSSTVEYARLDGFDALRTTQILGRSSGHQTAKNQVDMPIQECFVDGRS